MSDVIELLERLGRDLLHPDPAAMAALPAVERAALMAGDSAALAARIGARVSLCCAIIAPEGEPVPDDEADEPTDEPTDVPDEGESRAA